MKSEVLIVKDILPYIVTIITTIISGFLAYFSATKKSKSELISLRESNRLEIEKLMSQHKLDLESLERKHEMEKEKMKMEHEHKLVLMQKEAENAMGTNLMNTAVAEMMKTPEARQAMGSAFHSKKKR